MKAPDKARAEYLFERGLTMELSRKKTWAIGGALALVAFLIGFVPMSLKNRSLNYQLQQKERALAERTSNFQKQQAASLEKLRLAELNNQLGMLMIMTQEKNFGKARERSTRFFDGLRQLIQDTQDNSLREKLTPILNRRDEITADLTTADVGVTGKLRAFYQDMYELGVGQE
jgi:hypothetical protein